MSDIKFTIGCDPELFCFNLNTSTMVAVQNCGIKGTKKDPQLLPSGGNVQRDNVAIEFGIVPASNRLEFVDNIGRTLKEMVNILPQYIELKLMSSIHFLQDQLIHDECKEFGCDPDRSAWTMQENLPPENAADGTLRSCGGHIHVGYVQDSGLDFLLDYEGQGKVIRTMDIILGILSMVLDSTSGRGDRRKLYGNAGCYRQTSYGVEYRTLSNFWIISPNFVSLMYELVKDVLKIVKAGRDQQLFRACKNQSGMYQSDYVQLIIGDTNNYFDIEGSEIIYFLINEVLSEESFKLYKECYDEVLHLERFKFTPSEVFYENWKLRRR